MYGPLHTLIRQNGKMFKKILIILSVLLILISGTGCAGLGDYEIPIHSGYYITRINANEILLTHDRPDSPGNDIVIDSYFITGYWSNMDYIVLEGYWPGRNMKYYIVEVATGNVSDPFETKEDLESACLELDLDISEGWLTPSKP